MLKTLHELQPRRQDIPFRLGIKQFVPQGYAYLFRGIMLSPDLFRILKELQTPISLFLSLQNFEYKMILPTWWAASMTVEGHLIYMFPNKIIAQEASGIEIITRPLTNLEGEVLLRTDIHEKS